MTATDDSSKSTTMPAMKRPQRIVVMGVSGVGKSTLGAMLAERLGLPFWDADDFHSPNSRQKMQRGVALTDADRADWLALLAGKLADDADTGVVLACSALKQSYRSQLAGDLSLRWVWLKGSYDLIAQRLAERPGHFFAAELLQSQFEVLELPDDAIELEVSDPPQQLVEQLLRQLTEV